jgi:transposase
MNQHRLFDDGEVAPPQPEAPDGQTLEAPPRLRRPDRKQVEWRPVALDALLAEDHPVRMVWRYVDGLDLEPLYRQIAAVEGHAGRPAADRRVLLALWLQATLDGVGSARALDRLCREHVAYLWVCGGVSMNYHTLSDFRVAHGEFLDALLTESVATLMHQGVVTVERVAQDGLRVRASAGSSSFRRQGSLEACLSEAEEQVAALRRELETGPGGTARRQQAARARAARERADRVRRALEELEEVRAKRETRKKGSGAEARSSTTDAEARVMKMPGGGFRPGYNVQFATDTGSQVVVGVGVTNAGSDGGQLAPMADQIETRCGRLPGEMLADSDYAKREDIT